MGTTKRDGWGNLTFGEDNQESRERLRQLILFIAGRSRNVRRFGATKLNKILFYSDFLSFARYGRPITNTPYQKRPYGPVPSVIEEVKDEMVADKEIDLVNEGSPPYVNRRVFPLQEANIDAYFEPHVVALVDEVIEMLSDLSASEVSELSHDFAWQVADDYQPIPYEAVFIYDRELSEREIARAHELADKYGWDV